MNLNVNFAFGGAQTGAGNLIAFSAPAFVDATAAIGLELPGVFRQLDWAKATLHDVDPVQDLFWLYAGTNDILGTDFTAPNPALAPANLGLALNRMYNELGARTIVVPNLFDVGKLPIIDTFGIPPEQIPSARAGLRELTTDHNAILNGVVAEFLVANPDATVIPVDVFSIIEGSFPTFGDTTGTCVDDALPNGMPCDDYFFMDSVHPRSIAWELVVDAVIAAVNGIAPNKAWRRIITIGDSFSDMGLAKDTLEQALGVSPIIPSPPYNDGRFTDGPNVVDQLEARLGTSKTDFFRQPLITDLVASADERFVGSVEGITGKVQVPGSLSVEGGITGGSKASAVIEFKDAGVKCVYKNNPQFVLKHCQQKFTNKKFTAGDLVEVSGGEIKIKVKSKGFEANSISVELYHYN